MIKAKCHPSRKHYRKGLCRACHQRKWWSSLSVTEKCAKGKKYYKAFVSKYPDGYPEIRLRNKYGIGVKDYNAMLEAQKGVCAICGRSPKKSRLNIDHNHKTKQVRGLLCYRCNYGLGWFQDNINLFTQAANYLRRYK